MIIDSVSLTDPATALFLVEDDYKLYECALLAIQTRPNEKLIAVRGNLAITDKGAYMAFHDNSYIHHLRQRKDI